MGLATMAPKKASKGGKKAPAARIARTIQVSAGYAEWLERFAVRERVNISSLIDRALAAHAEAVGFEPPPERVP